jgi:hypothetical protein
MKEQGFQFFAAHTDTATKIAFIAGSLLLGALFIAGLTFVPRRARKPLIAVVTFVAGLYFSLEYLLPAKETAERVLEGGNGVNRTVRALFGWYLRPLAGSRLDADQNFLSPSVQQLTTAWQVIAGFTFALGLWNLVHIHGKSILRGSKNWFFSALFFLGFAAMALAGFMSTHGPYKGMEESAAVFDLATRGLLFALDAAMFSLIAFFIISAAYRSFRIRSAEATIMMVSAFLVMLGQVPIGIWLTSWIPETGFISNYRLEHISYWILTQPNAAAQRGINFGLAVGAMAMALRIWLSLERGSYFEREL